MTRLLCAAAATVMAFFLFTAAAHAAGEMSEQLAVTGAVRTPLVLRVQDLQAFAPAQIESVSVTHRVGDRDVATVERGVRLAAVLERAGHASSDKNEWKHTVVLATATDGYQVVFSWPELFNTEVGAAALVVFERDGAPLSDREGRIALVSARDLQTGPRSVKWLKSLSVIVVKE